MSDEYSERFRAAGIAAETIAKWQRLLARLASFPSVLVAYSGGVDSTFLAYAATLVLHEKCLAFRVATDIESQQQTDFAERWAAQLGLNYQAIPFRMLEREDFAQNSPDRCYTCKRTILSLLQQVGREQHIQVFLEGQNADDAGDYRPGRKAVLETGTLSPLAEVGLTKDEIRQLARALELPVWNLPSSPCLATRVPYGERITVEKLHAIEAGEDYLQQLGLTQVRVRHHGDTARLEVQPADMAEIVRRHAEVFAYFRSLGFTYVTLDLRGYSQGSLNERITQA
jgi:uncharacterized protein